MSQSVESATAPQSHANQEPEQEFEESDDSENSEREETSPFTTGLEADQDYQSPTVHLDYSDVSELQGQKRKSEPHVKHVALGFSDQKLKQAR